jgi:DNA (cytosine-5)-methyltransferase 1
MNKPELTMIEFFSGIGAQKRGIDNTELYNLKVVATSDVDKEALVEYAAIHHGLTNEMIENYEGYPSREDMVEELKSRNIGMDFDKGKMFDWDKLLKKKTKEIEKYWLSMTLQNNLGDISKIEQAPTADCWFYSSPCQCFSLAGKQDGIDATCNACGQKYNPMDYDVEHRYVCPHCGSDDIKGTRSGLLLEVERLLIKAIETNTAPKYLCLENVKNLVGKQFKPDFDAWIKRLEHLGYNTYWQVLNAKECGVPQNRERVFAFSIRKDIDTGKYTFPLPFDTGIRLKDILEKNVDEKYYINTERASNLIQQLVDKGQLKGQRECCDSTINDPNVRDVSNAILARYDAGIMNHKSVGLAVAEPQEQQPILVKNQATEYTRTVDTANTLMARDWKGFGNQDMIAIVESEKIDNAERIGGMFDGDTRHQAGSVWNTNGLAPTLDTMQGGLRQPCVVEDTTETIQNKNATKSTWKDINSHYKISSKGVVVDVVNKCQVEEIDGKVELEVKGKMAKFPIDALMKKYFAEVDTTKPICVGNTTPSGKSQCNAVYSTEGVSQTLCAGTHGYATGSILEEQESEVIGIKQATKKGYIECELPGCADFSFPNSTKRRGRVQGGEQIVPTLTAAEGGIRYIESIYRIRKLTVRECFKLMGFEFSDWDKCEKIGISNSAGYKAAGNSIAVCCIELLFEHLYKAQYDESYICTDERWQNK